MVIDLSDLPGSCPKGRGPQDGRATHGTCLVLLRMGFALPQRSPVARCALTLSPVDPRPHPFTLTPHLLFPEGALKEPLQRSVRAAGRFVRKKQVRGGLLSVALSVTSRCPRGASRPMKSGLSSARPSPKGTRTATIGPAPAPCRVLQVCVQRVADQDAAADLAQHQIIHLAHLVDLLRRQGLEAASAA